MATTADWIEGARLRTLPAAVAPVLLGTGAAAQVGGLHVGRALLAAGVALALQIGTNYANDYSDGVRGTDDVRSGPPRLTGGGLVAPATVKRAAFTCFGVAAVLGLALVAWSGTWWLLAVGVAAILAAWYYTGGTHPYGYMGLSEIVCFVFFGLVATAGTTLTQALTVPASAWVGACAMGALSCAMLMINNIRDIPTDSLTGKHTLAVRLGDRPARLTWVAMVAAAVVLSVAAVLPSFLEAALVALVLVPWAVVVARTVLAGAAGRDLIAVLGSTGRLQLVVGVLVGVLLAL